MASRCLTANATKRVHTATVGHLRVNTPTYKDFVTPFSRSLNYELTFIRKIRLEICMKVSRGRFSRQGIRVCLHSTPTQQQRVIRKHPYCVSWIKRNSSRRFVRCVRRSFPIRLECSLMNASPFGQSPLIRKIRI